MSADLTARLEILEIELQTVRMLANQASATPGRIAAAHTREEELRKEIGNAQSSLNQLPPSQIE